MSITSPTSPSSPSKLSEPSSPSSPLEMPFTSSSPQIMQIGDWKLTKLIGQGATGRVVLAIHQYTGEKRACKILPRPSAAMKIPSAPSEQPGPGPILLTSSLQDLPQDLLDFISVAPNPRATIYSSATEAQRVTPEERRKTRQATMSALSELRTLREILIMLLLNHPNIAKLIEFAVTDGHWYLFFEYVSGGQLLDYIISRGRLKEHVARKFVRGIVSAMDYCHRSSVVHRDLKIENILISKSGKVKIIDFGLSNLYSPDSLLKTFCGSLYFAAPELLTSREYIGPEVDIWSLGVIVYVLVVGRVPFDSTSVGELHAKIKAGQVEYPSWLSPQCKHFLSRLLVVDPQQRASMYEIRHHPWITKDFGIPPEDHVPFRQPLANLKPDEWNATVLANMKGFGYGSNADDIFANLLEEITEKPGGEIQVIANVTIPPGQGLADSVGQSIYWLVKEKLEREEASGTTSLARSISSVTSRSSSQGDLIPSPTVETPTLTVPQRHDLIMVHRTQSLPLPRYQGPLLVPVSSSDLNASPAESGQTSPQPPSLASSPFPEATPTLPRIVLTDGTSEQVQDTDSEGDPDLAWENTQSMFLETVDAKPHILQRSKSATTSFPVFEDKYQNPLSPYQSGRDVRQSRSRTKESGIAKALKRLTISKSPGRGPLTPPSPTSNHSRSVSNSSVGSTFVGMSPTLPSPQQFGPTLTVPGQAGQTGGHHHRVQSWQPDTQKSDASSFGTLYGGSGGEEECPRSNVPRADEQIRTVSLKGLFSVANTTSLAPGEIRDRLINCMTSCNMKWTEGWGGFEVDWNPLGRRVSTDRILSDVQPVASPLPLQTGNSTQKEYFDMSVHERRESVPLDILAMMKSTSTSQDKSVKFEVKIVKLPWLPSGKTFGVLFHRIRGDGLQYRQLCAKLLEELRL